MADLEPVAYNPTQWVNDSEPDIDENTLNNLENGIVKATDHLNALIAQFNTLKGEMVMKNQIVNNLLATDPTTVLAAPMGKALSAKVAKLNGDLNNWTVAIKVGDDCNNLLNGLWLIDGPVNGPGIGWWLVVSVGDVYTRKQVAYDIFNAQPPKTRCHSNSVAGPWQSVSLSGLTANMSIQKDVPTLTLGTSNGARAEVAKNASGSGDYGTIISDFTGGIRTTIKIQGGKLWIDDREVATK